MQQSNLKIKTITVGAYVKYKPNRAQFDNGKTVINTSRVQKLKKTYKEVLFENQDLIQVTDTARIVSGHHRQALCKELLKEGLVDSSDKLIVLEFKGTTAKGIDKAALYHNFGHNTSNKKAQMVNHSAPVAKRVFKPINDALRMGTLGKVLKDKSYDISINLGALFNNNPMLCKQVLAGKAGLTGAEIYDARKLPEVGLGFLDIPANLDLRGRELDLFARFREAGEVLQFLLDDPQWSMLREGSDKKPKSVIYALLGASTARQIESTKSKAKGKITLPKVKKAIRSNVSTIRNFVSLFNTSPVGQEGIFISTLKGE